MEIGSRVAERLMRLPRAHTRTIHIERDLPAKMTDGTILLADRYYPDGGSALPIVLIRTPYGRRQSGLQAKRFAERGYQVVVQSCRGTFGSGGTWAPFRDEREDGLDTLSWVAGQPWFRGEVVTYGGSYLGLTQWAIAEDAPAFVKATAPAVTAANFRDIVTYPGGSFALSTVLAWVTQVRNQEKGFVSRWGAIVGSPWRLRKAFATLPLNRADSVAVGESVDFYQDWLAHELPDDPFWATTDFRPGTATMPPPALVAGWYDIFLPAQLADYAALRDAGRKPRLTVGPWTHTSAGLLATGIRDALEWFDIHTGRRPPPVDDAPVRVFLLGAKRWVNLPDWPPPSTTAHWYLQPGGVLAPGAPSPSTADHYRYDPADPTPSAGGTALSWWDNGPKDNKRRESRADVLVYTSDTLTSDLTVAGTIVADLRLRSSHANTDLFIRVCDVAPNGKSTNIADGILRRQPADATPAADSTYRLRVDVGPVAVTFPASHRVRLQVSSGAHPVYARNPGSGERLAVASRLVPSEHDVFHDSVLELPVVDV